MSSSGWNLIGVDVFLYFECVCLSFSLTVEEHVWFYGCMKGLSEEEVKAELDTLLEDVGLLHKRHEQTKNLSGIVFLLFLIQLLSSLWSIC